MPLIAHYPLHEDSGSTVEDVRGTYDGSTNGGPTQGASGILGSTAYGFDGADDVVDLEYSSTLSPDKITVSAWFNTDDATGAGRIVDCREGGGTNGYLLRYNQSSVDWYVVADADHSVSGGSISTGTWHHVVATYDTNTMKLYVDGVEVASSTSNSGPITDPTEGVAIGARNSDNTKSNTDGRIADVRFYDHALTPGEVQYLYSVSQSASAVSGVRTL